MAEPSNSIAALMKNNARLKRNVEVAKKVVARKDYSGPAGEVVVRFAAKVVLMIESVPAVILEFRVDGDVPGQADYNGERISIFHKFQDDQWNTVESVQARLYEDLQLMGLDTISMTTEEVDKALDAMKKASPHFTMRVIKKKGKGANASKTYTNYRLVGLVASQDDDYSSDDGLQGDATDDTTDNDDVDDLPDDDDTTDSDTTDDDDDDEWEDELSTDDVPSDDAASTEYQPTDWIGYEVQYKPPKAVKAMKFMVTGADDKNQYVILERNGKKTGDIPYADIILPDDE